MSKEINHNNLTHFPWPITFPNQKVAVVRKNKLNKNYLSISNENWQAAFRNLTGATFAVYLQLMSNADGFPYAIGAKQGIEQLGISERTYQQAIKTLIEKDYLVLVGGNVYQAYETSYNETLKPEKTSALEVKEETGKNYRFKPEEIVTQTGKNYRFKPEEITGDIDKKDITDKIDSYPSISKEEDVRRQLKVKGLTDEHIDAMLAVKTSSVWEEKGYGLMFTQKFQAEHKPTPEQPTPQLSQSDKDILEKMKQQPQQVYEHGGANEQVGEPQLFDNFEPGTFEHSEPVKKSNLLDMSKF